MFLDVTTHNAAISACEEGEQWQQALVLLATARRFDVLLKVITYNTAICVGEKGKQWQQAL